MSKLVTRKELRKQKRKEKKSRKNEYFMNLNKKRKNVTNPNKKQKTKPNVTQQEKKQVVQNKPVINLPNKTKTSKKRVRQNKSSVDLLEAGFKKEKNEQQKLEKEMRKQRMEQLKRANLAEDKTIKRLEKQLKLTKRKSKSMPKSFSSDGLDYILEMCDPENMSKVVSAEQQLAEGNDGFDEDLNLITGTGQKQKNRVQESDDEDLEENQDKFSDLDFVDEEEEEDAENEFSEDDDMSEEEEEIGLKRKKSQNDAKENKKQKICRENSDEEMEESDDDRKNENTDGTWTDIYGRLRGKDGSVIEESSEKYIPPAVRAKMAVGQTDDKKTTEKLIRLQRQLKGLVNRLAESNMHSISTQIENLYMNNSRNDMNETLTNLLLNSLVSTVFTPERLLLEHVMLIAILHANVGTEVGAHFLQVMVKKFDDLTTSKQEMENKTLDNVVMVLAQLYNFKIFHCQLIQQIIERLAHDFDEEKHIECILHVLKSVGFTLRKDDPVALKNLILNILTKAATIREETKKENARIKFMLDILTAIKNNNVTKIPNYDTTYSEHLKKLLKGFIRKGNYVTQLNIGLEDLLKADERGKWWVVGSAWTGNALESKQKDEKPQEEAFSQELLDLAKKLKINTDTRKKIFCTLMAADDQSDAYEKLLRLGLKGQEEREIMNLILYCCLREKTYNPFYAAVAQKFCEHDRKYQMNTRCAVWDKLQTLTKCSVSQLANLTKFLIYLFIEKGLPISILKKIQFSDLDKVTLRFVRQILLGILLHDNTEECLGVFEKVAISDQLKMFKESIRLFIHHFVLKNLKDGAIDANKKQLLETRAQVVTKLLNSKQRSKLW